MSNEMVKLRKYLDNHNVEWIDGSDDLAHNINQNTSNGEPTDKYVIYRTRINYCGHVLSVICGYLVRSMYDTSEDETLELQLDHDEPVRMLLADDIIDILKRIRILEATRTEHGVDFSEEELEQIYYG